MTANDVHMRTHFCPVTEALKILSGKWRMPILWKLSAGPVRYNELKKQMTGITNIMLTRALKELEAARLVQRVEYDTLPLHVEYSLTDEGQALMPALNILKEWGLSVVQQNEHV